MFALISVLTREGKVQQETEPTTETLAVVAAASTTIAEPTALPTDLTSIVTSPTLLPVLLPTVTPTQAPTPVPTARSARLYGIQHAWQTWNNCGPATLAMALSYYGSDLDQAAAGAALRGNPDDKNVSPAELIAFARAQGFQARLLVNGDADRLRRLIDAGVPVLIETWLDPEDAGGLGHYRLLVGYDDDAEAWIAYDTYVGVNLVDPQGDYQGIWLPYAETEALWKVFNRTAVVIYRDEERAAVDAVLGPVDADYAMWAETVADAQAEIERDNNDAYAWFNLGTGLTALGSFADAAAAYDQAQQLGLPWRMLWYQFGPFEAYYQTGRHQDVLRLADATLSDLVQIEEILYWRSRSLQALGDAAGADQAWQTARALNPAYGETLEPAPPGVSLSALN